nr:MAG TPA: repressor [Caudoviricetes sp.]
MDNIEENEVRFTMRMNADLYEELKEQARLNRRSIAKELENIVDLQLHKDSIIELPEEVAKRLNAYIAKFIKENMNTK